MTIKIFERNQSPIFIVVYLLSAFLLFSVDTFDSSNLAFADDTQPTLTKKRSAEKLVYLVSDIRIPFWNIMARGIKNRAHSLGYKLEILSAKNSAKQELKNTVQAIKNKVAGIVVSPTNSSACVTMLKLAKKAGIPVVISDIGTDAGEYVSYISSDNKKGAYQIGKVLSTKLKQHGWETGSVGIVAIPQKRINGQLRTAGFMQAMDEAGIKGADIKQQSDFSYKETYNFSKEIIKNNPDLHAIFIQGSDRYQAALDAIADSGRKDKILLISFDSEPIFLELIPKGILVGAAMQQPYLMGQEAVKALDNHLKGKAVKRNNQLPVLAISSENITAKLAVIKRNVLGITE